MKRTYCRLIAAALWTALCPAAAWAQAPAYYQSEYPAYPGAGVAPASAMMMMGGGEAAPEGGGAAACCSDCCGPCGMSGPLGRWCWPCGGPVSDLGEACKLWQPCCEDSQWSMNGWLAQSYTWNPYSPNDRFNGPVTWTDRANEYQMNELWLGGGRATKTDGAGFDLGGRVDAFYGTNYRWDTSAGFETHFGNGNFYGLAVPNAYLVPADNTGTVKVGRFISPVGYYTVGTANNFFPVIPYTYQYGEPFTHTGVWATKKVNDDWVVGGAVTHGWDSSDNTGNPHAGGLLTAAWTIDEQRSLAWVGVLGNEPNLTNTNTYAYNGLGYTSRYFQTLVYTRKFSDNVMGVLQSDFGTQHDAVFDPNSGLARTAKWYGLNGYLYWNMTCRCQWGLNGEWFRDQGGFRVGQVLPSFGSPHARGLGVSAGQTRFGYDGSFYRLTFGPRYYFTPNVYTRIALLADWYQGKNNNPNNQRPFDDGTKNYQQLMVFDLVGTF
jgi:hypothetical protein